MSDRRKSRRWHLVFYLEVKDRRQSRPLGHLVDISTGGIAVLSKQSIALSMDYDLSLELPEEVDASRSLNFSAKALWSSRDVNPDYLVTGFRFLSLQQDDLLIVEDLIRALKFDA